MKQGTVWLTNHHPAPQTPLASLGLLANVVAAAASCRLTSAGLLNLLHAKAAALAGDRVGRALLHRVMHAAATPYFRCAAASCVMIVIPRRSCLRACCTLHCVPRSRFAAWSLPAADTFPCLTAACVTAYFRMLERWLCEGLLDDPHGEFMVQEDKVRACQARLGDPDLGV